MIMTGGGSGKAKTVIGRVTSQGSVVSVPSGGDTVGIDVLRSAAFQRGKDGRRMPSCI